MATEFELRITELYTEGKPITLIAQRFSVEPREVISMLKRLHVYDANREEKGAGASKAPKREQTHAPKPVGASRPSKERERERERERQPRVSGPTEVLPTNEDMLSARIVALHNQGLMPDEIAKTVGRQRHMVIYTLHKAGAQLQPKEPVSRQKPEESHAEAVEPAVEPVMEPVAEPAAEPVVESAPTPAPAPAGKIRKKKTGRWSEEVVQAVVQVARQSLYPKEPEEKVKAMVEALNRRPRS